MNMQDRAGDCWSCSVAVPAGAVRAATETSETPSFLRLVAGVKQQKGKEMNLTPASLCNRTDRLENTVVS